MKVIVHTKGILFIGKGREIVKMLKEYNQSYLYVSEWIKANSVE